MQKDNKNNKESEEYNNKMTWGRNTIRTTKSENTKVGQ